jgi:hypothetical protein
MSDGIVVGSTRAALVLLGLVFAGCGGCDGDTTEVRPAASVAPPGAAPASASPLVASTPEPDAGGEAAALPGVERDPTGVRRCCLAVGRNVPGAPSEHKATWQTAFDACNRAAEGDAGRAGLEPVRKLLKEVGWPAACQ